MGALIGRVAAGDRAALGTLYEMTVSTLFAFARKVLRNPADVEEVLCDVYTQAWQTARQYDSTRGTVMAWLIVICRTRAIDRLRRNQLRSWNSAGECGSIDSSSCEELGPEDLLHALQQGTVIHGAIARLSPLRRRLVALAFFHDLSHTEIARMTELALGTVKSHLRRALATLRRELGQEANEAAEK